MTKKTKLDAVRKQIAETKEVANAAFKQERALREKAWYDNRVSEIHNLTWKGTCVQYAYYLLLVWYSPTVLHSYTLQFL